MKKVHLIVFAIILGSINISCKKDDNPVATNPTTNVILPLKSGNVWVFQRIFYDTTGSITQYDTLTLTVGRDTTVTGETWYQLADDYNFWSNKANGAFRIIAGPSPVSPQLCFKYPGSIADTWTTHRITDTVQTSIQSTSLSVTVPSGTYSCYQYQTTKGSILCEVNYLSPNIGIIAFDIYSQKASGAVYKEFRCQLISMTLK